MKSLLMKLLKKVVPERIKKYYRVQAVYSATKEYTIVVSNEPKLKGKTAVVTGGNGAIGRAVCFKLAAEGAKVYVSGRNSEKVNNVVEEIRSKGLLAEPMIMDVSDANSIENAFNTTFENEKLDILINCAGGGAREKASSLDKLPIEVIDDILNTNLRGTILCSRKALQIMIKNNTKGKILIISSAVGVGGMKNYSEYGAAKAGDVGFMKSLALEAGQYGITVNCLSPGKVERGDLTQQHIDYIKGTNCLKSFCTMEDIANPVCFMVSDGARFITGQNICVDGGRTLGLYGDTH